MIIGIKMFKVWIKNFEKLGGGFFKIGMVRGEIVADVEEMLLIIMGRVNEVSMFYCSKKGEVVVKETEPISMIFKERLF